MKATFRSATLFVKDIAASRRFYEQFLGQQVELDFGVNIGYASGLALWEVKSAYEIIFNREPEADLSLGHNNLEVYFEVEDLEAAQHTLTAAGVRFVHPIIEQPWAQRTLRAYDPDGHIVEVAEPMDAVVRRLAADGLSAEAIHQRTSMPQPIIVQILAGQPTE